MTVRRVDKDGRFAFGNRQWRMGKAFAGLPVGLAASGKDGCYNVRFDHHLLAKIDLTVQIQPIQTGERRRLCRSRLRRDAVVLLPSPHGDTLPTSCRIG